MKSHKKKILQSQGKVIFVFMFNVYFVAHFHTQNKKILIFKLDTNSDA